jgi:hypothetical protein
MNKVGPSAQKLREPRGDEYISQAMTTESIATEFQKLEEQWQTYQVQRTRSFVIAGLLINIEFTSQLLESVLCDALSHLEQPHLNSSNSAQRSEPGEQGQRGQQDQTTRPERLNQASLTIRAWDACEHQSSIAPLRWDLLHANGYRGVSDGNYFFQFFDSISAISFLSLEHKTAYYVVKNTQELPWWVRGSPLQAIFSAFFRAKGVQLTHVAAVGNKDRCVLLAGKGGSGKTTTTLACLQHGLTYLGEDYCLIEPTANNTIVHSVYQSAKWTPQTRMMYPEFDRFVHNQPTTAHDKSLLFYKECFTDQIGISLPAIAIASLSIHLQAKPTLMVTNKTSSLKQLTLSTIKQLPFFDHQTYTLLRQCCETVSHYDLQLGTDREGNALMIECLLDEATR